MAWKDKVLLYTDVDWTGMYDRQTEEMSIQLRCYTHVSATKNHLVQMGKHALQKEPPVKPVDTRDLTMSTAWYSELH